MVRTSPLGHNNQVSSLVFSLVKTNFFVFTVVDDKGIVSKNIFLFSCRKIYNKFLSFYDETFGVSERFSHIFSMYRLYHSKKSDTMNWKWFRSYSGFNFKERKSFYNISTVSMNFHVLFFFFFILWISVSD